MQAFTQHTRQIAIITFRNVRHCNFRRIQFSPRPHRTDDRQAQLQTMINQEYLRRQGIDSIHDIVVSGHFQYLDHPVIPDKIVNHMQFNLRIDIPEPPGHNLRLGFSQITIQSRQLPVLVGQFHHIPIDNRHFAYPGPAQLFGSICSHPS